jgi:transcriptional regulator of acetoin/glycerol metabolism
VSGKTVEKEGEVTSWEVSLDPERLLTLKELGDDYLRRVTDVFGGNKTKAARALGIDRRTLYRRWGDK